MTEHVVRVVPAPRVVMGGAGLLLAVPAATDNLIWVLGCQETRQAVIVDGPPELDAVLPAISAAGLTLVGVLNTHTHPDHIGVNQALERAGLLAGLRVVGPAKVAAQIPGLTEPVVEGAEVVVGALRLRVWETEGHLRGHVCFVGDGLVFCGDKLFAAGCGYVFSGPAEVMAESLFRLASLPAETLVVCAHEYTRDNLAFALFLEPGNAALQARAARLLPLLDAGETVVPSTIGEECETNPFLRPGSPELQAALRVRWPELALGDLRAVFAATRAFKNERPHVGRVAAQ